ncbi:hypothetical protein SmJEL517_g03273 [Synchytrium microbalum]|uniref:Cytochrome P450 n=1 Tax=Synchytrium microbalum TaxID=1806994 RepID=A0A507C7P3_9FUNG|nr:uncharacterized protein SmJEL517_g03273 [Synchytrium microbalum]TPX34084.1 hypothetical protein SmJEL517_g03273 [Synchytrium microbalum]
MSESIEKSFAAIVKRIEELKVPVWVWGALGAVTTVSILRSLFRPPHDAKGYFAYPILGNLPQVGSVTRMAHYELESVLKHGYVTKSVLAGNEFLLTADPAIVKKILNTEMDDWGRGKGLAAFVFEDVAGGLIIQPNGQEWKETRKFFDPSFGVPSIKSYTPIIQGRMDKFLTWLDGQAKSSVNNIKGPGVPLENVLHGITFDIIVMIVLGFDPDSISSGGHSRYVQAWEYVLKSLQERFPLAQTQYWKWMKTPAVRKYDREYALLTNLVMDRRDHYLKNGVKSTDVDMMAQFVQKSKADASSVPPPLTREDREFCLHYVTMIFAGHDTTASGSAWTFIFLAQNPEYKRRVYEEIKSLGSAPFTYEALESLPFLNAVVKETLRLRPSAPDLFRYMEKDKTYEWIDDEGVKRSHFVPKGCEQGYQPYVIHMHPRNYDNPTKFDPDRWLDGRAKNYDQYAYVAFGGGPRRCLGEKLALYEIKTVVSTLLRAYDYELVEGSKPEFVNASTMRLKDGLYLNLKRR